MDNNESYKNKNVILDIDKTLLFSNMMFDDETEDASEIIKPFISHNIGDYYTVYERPYLQKFLDHVFEKYNVSIWTNGSKNYAISVLTDVLHANVPQVSPSYPQYKHNDSREEKIERNVDLILFSYHCKMSKVNYGIKKDVRLLWEVLENDRYSATNTILLDDLPDVCDQNEPNNVEKVKPFTAKTASKYDMELIRILQSVEKKFSMQCGPDVADNRAGTPWTS
jgi:hypothetical protein